MVLERRCLIAWHFQLSYAEKLCVKQGGVPLMADRDHRPLCRGASAPRATIASLRRRIHTGRTRSATLARAASPVPEGGAVLGQTQRRTAHLLRLSSRASASHPHRQPE